MSSLDAAAHALAGAAGGVLAMAALYPLENVRTRLQVQVAKTRIDNDRLRISLTNTPYHSHIHINGHGHSAAPRAYHFSGAIDCIRQVCAREGWRALYTGLSSALIGVGVSSAAYFYFYRLLKKISLRRSRQSSLNAIDNLMIASLAGILNVFITMPIWTIQTRQTLAAKQDRQQSLSDAGRHIVSTEGWTALYKGLVPSLILVSNPAIQFLVYEQMIEALSLYYHRRHRPTPAIVDAVTTVTKNIVQSTSLSHTVSLPQSLTHYHFFVLGAISKAIATVATYPYQVVKARQQADNRPQSSILEIIETMRTIYREEGAVAFWRGMNAKLVQTVLNSAFMFAAYETLVRWFLWALIRARASEKLLHAH